MKLSAKADYAVRAVLVLAAHEESQYFIPNIETKIMNEGWASYWHREILNSLNLPQELHLAPCRGRHRGLPRGPTRDRTGNRHAGERRAFDPAELLERSTRIQPPHAEDRLES